GQDNCDGTYTQLDDDYYVPATGWSYLDLYLMGLISSAEVPDFFILRNLVPANKDANGHPIFKADRTKLTIQDVIAAEGPRLPGVDKSQREFNTGIAIMVQHGDKPNAELIERAEGIRKQWMDYFAITTGHRASMTGNPRGTRESCSPSKPPMSLRTEGVARMPRNSSWRSAIRWRMASNGAGSGRYTPPPTATSLCEMAT